MKKTSRIYTKYKYSLRKRISSTYISIYIVICIIMMVTFIAGYALYSFSKFSSYTPTIANSIITKISSEESIEEDEFRFFLSSLAADSGAAEVFVYNSANTLIAATSYAKSNIDFFDDVDRNVFTSLFPQFSKIQEGYYADIYSAPYDKYPVKIVVFYSIGNTLQDYIFIAELLGATMAAGLLLFMIVGFSRTDTMLKPISEMTKVAKLISGENMNLRIDEKDAKFELKELAATINSMIDRIQLSYDKQKRFVSDVSHELRTPIAVISGYGAMLKRWGKNDPEILDESIDAIINEASNMNDLVEKLLFLARHDNENIKFEMQETDVSKICEDLVKETILVHEDFKVELDIKEAVIANVDEMRIKQCFRIFIDNALKYSFDKKEIKIALYPQEDSFVFTVKDSGIGISKEDLPNIFDRFYRADESRTKATGGYGLGLAMAKIIVLGHKGKINVRSKINEGSEFIIKIPLFPKIEKQAKSFLKK